jgi:hypothetical protein
MSLAGSQPRPQYSRRGKCSQFALLAGEVIVFDNSMTIGSVGELEAEHFGIALRLLQPIGGELIRGFWGDKSKRNCAPAIRAVYPYGNIVLGFTCHSAGMAADALALVDDKCVLRHTCFPLIRQEEPG